MTPICIFMSSVQREFSRERERDYLRGAAHADHRFRGMSSTDSDPCRPPIPTDVVHLPNRIVANSPVGGPVKVALGRSPVDPLSFSQGPHHCFGIAVDDGQQDSSRPVRDAPPLFPATSRCEGMAGWAGCRAFRIRFRGCCSGETARSCTRTMSRRTSDLFMSRWPTLSRPSRAGHSPGDSCSLPPPPPEWPEHGVSPAAPAP